MKPGEGTYINVSLSLCFTVRVWKKMAIPYTETSPVSAAAMSAENLASVLERYKSMCSFDSWPF